MLRAAPLSNAVDAKAIRYKQQKRVCFTFTESYKSLYSQKRTKKSVLCTVIHTKTIQIGGVYSDTYKNAYKSVVCTYSNRSCTVTHTKHTQVYENFA